MVLVLGKSGSQTVMFFSEEVVWGTKYAEKNECTLIRKILLLAGQTLQINMKIKKKKCLYPSYPERRGNVLHAHPCQSRDWTGRERARGHRMGAAVHANLSILPQDA